jgi:hypothetical protein
MVEGWADPINSKIYFASCMEVDAEAYWPRDQVCTKKLKNKILSRPGRHGKQLASKYFNSTFLTTIFLKIT